MEYGLSQATYKKGDIITETYDKSEIIVIDKIGVDVSFGEVRPVYSGYLLNKDMTRKKNETRGSIYGNTNTKLILAA